MELLQLLKLYISRVTVILKSKAINWKNKVLLFIWTSERCSGILKFSILNNCSLFVTFLEESISSKRTRLPIHPLYILKCKVQWWHTLEDCFPGCSTVARSWSASAAIELAWRSRTWSWPRRSLPSIAFDSSFSESPFSLNPCPKYESASASFDGRADNPRTRRLATIMVRTAAVHLLSAWMIIRRVFSMHFRRIVRNDMIESSLWAAGMPAMGCRELTLSESNDSGDRMKLRSPTSIEPLPVHPYCFLWTAAAAAAGAPEDGQIRSKLCIQDTRTGYMQAARADRPSRLRVGTSTPVGARFRIVFPLRGALSTVESGNKQAVDRGRREIVRLRCVGDRFHGVTGTRVSLLDELRRAKFERINFRMPASAPRHHGGSRWNRTAAGRGRESLIAAWSRRVGNNSVTSVVSRRKRCHRKQAIGKDVAKISQKSPSASQPFLCLPLSWCPRANEHYAVTR